MALVTTLSLEFSIVGLKKDAYDPRRIWFEFEDTDDLQKTVSDFWSGKVKVEPQKLFNQLKMIKTRIYNL